MSCIHNAELLEATSPGTHNHDCIMKSVNWQRCQLL